MHRVAARVAVLTGLAALALVDGLALAAGGGAVTVLAATPLARGLSRLPWGLLTVLAVGMAGALALWGAAPTVSLGGLLVYLQVHAHLSEPPDDRRSLVLSALMVVTAAGSSTDPWFGPLALGWAFALPIACLTGAGRLPTTLLVSLGSIVVSMAVWVAAPRIRPDEAAVELTGFTPEVELGTLDALLDDPGVVFRAAVHPPLDEAIYWRGVALDTFDGRRWTSSTAPVSTRMQPPRALPPDVVAFEVEPDEPGLVLTAGWPLALDAGPVPLYADGHGAWSVRVPPVRYTMVSQGPFGLADHPVTPPEVDDALLARARTLPPNLDPRIASLAAREAGEGRPIEQVRRLAAYLRSHQVYTRTPYRESDAPLSAFLFEQPAGHCEYFASALAVLARTRGIPSRIVNGFVGGQRDPGSGTMVVRRKDAHTWVEVYDRGWWRVDATPGPASEVSSPRPVALTTRLRTAWDQRILDFDRADQIEALVALARAAERVLAPATSHGKVWEWLAGFGGGAMLAALGVWAALRRWEPRDAPSRRAQRGPVARAHRRARRIVAERGWDLPPGAPPVEAANALRASAPGPAADALVELAWLYYATNLGGDDSRAVRHRAQVLVRAVVLVARRDRDADP